MTNHDFTQWQQHTQQQVETLLEHALIHRLQPELKHITTQHPFTLHEAMCYVALDGGKRLRPLLVWAAAELGNSIQAACHAAAVAVECIHVYSLVHDDMPMMDNDNLRRGKPTCHVQYDEATALLVGDALQTLAFDVLSEPTSLSAIRQLRMIQTLAKAAGIIGMVGGQAIDCTNVGIELSQTQLEQMHSWKTGALIRSAVALGALSCPDLDDAALAALDEYAIKLGLAFQVIDDVLDCEADTATLGKTAGKDVQANKPTYVKLMGLTPARQYAETLIEQALAAIAPFGEPALRLRQLAEFVVQRKN